MKKFLAVLMSAVLLLGILAGCNADQPAGTDTTDGAVSTPMAAGMLVLNANASVNISYDDDGLVLDVEGIDDDGSSLAGEYTDYLGKSCSEAVCDLIGNSKVVGYLSNEANYVMIKLAMDSALPGATFLETIQKDAEAAIAQAQSNAKLVFLTEENLDDEGYINLESAKQLLLAHLALESFDTLDGTTEPINGVYGFAVTAGALEGDFMVDAVTGVVFEGQLEGISSGDEQLDEEVDNIDTTEEVFVEDETTDPTQPPESTPESFEDIVEEPVSGSEAEAEA